MQQLLEWGRYKLVQLGSIIGGKSIDKRVANKRMMIPIKKIGCPDGAKTSRNHPVNRFISLSPSRQTTPAHPNPSNSQGQPYPNTRRSMLLKVSRCGDSSRSTLSWWRSVEISTCSDARDRNNPISANQIRLQTSLINQEHRPIRPHLLAGLSFRQWQASGAGRQSILKVKRAGTSGRGKCPRPARSR